MKTTTKTRSFSFRLDEEVRTQLEAMKSKRDSLSQYISEIIDAHLEACARRAATNQPGKGVDVATGATTSAKGSAAALYSTNPQDPAGNSSAMDADIVSNLTPHRRAAVKRARKHS